MLIENFQKFIDESVTPYHCINNIKNILNEKGFTEINFNDLTNINFNSKYYIIKDNTSVISFITPNSDKFYFKMVANHVDSPCFKLKSNIFKDNTKTTLDIQPYGGMIVNSWFDKPLGLAGALYYKNNNLTILNNTPTNSINNKIINIPNIGIIPNSSIHLKSELNNGYKYDIASNISPIISNINTDLISYISNNFNINKDSILSHDLFIYNNTKSETIGINKDMICSARLDNLASVYSNLHSFINSNSEDLNILVSLDNEEVGSSSTNGACSNFVSSIIKSIHSTLNNKINYYEYINNSIMVSCDNAHAYNPNFAIDFDTNNIVHINKGVVIKNSPSLKYTTSAKSKAIIKFIANKCNLNLQEYYNPNNKAGGSTLGNILLSDISCTSIDIGIASYAMHSANETIGINDLNDMYLLIKEFYNSNITINTSITIK